MSMEIGHIKQREIIEEMKESYLDYAMSVIVSRALPDVRDGLKPVHRRILYAMWEDGLRHDAKFRKSASVIGSVLSKYHPHGDIAVYDALVRIAQDFSLRYPLVQGQGNFGSIDGDSAAAYRYTEARLSKIGEEILKDIEKETVDFSDNYDGTKKEPVVLPSPVPQLLLNGSMGIAVGMATNIPPHNLSEVCDALIYLIENPDSSTEDLCQFIKGPDFPTGGFIYDQKAIVQTYSLGKGAIICRAKTEIVETKKGQWQILVTEIPYQVNKSALLERIAELIKEKKLEGIRDMCDESDKEGLRIMIELKSDSSPQKVLNQLYKLTDLQKTFHLNMLALIDGLQPQILSLKGLLEQYLIHRYEVTIRRTKYDLKKTKERAHILEGLKIAQDSIDQVISTIRKSETKEKAKENLIKKFKLTEIQALAILAMPLASLAKLERQKIEEELKEKRNLIKELEAILKSPKKIQKVICQEFLEIKAKYGDERRTKIFKGPVGQISEEDLIVKEECIITLTEGGYIKRISPKVYRVQHRGGKGILGILTREEDTVKYFLSASTHDWILFFTDRGRVFQTKAYEIPAGSRIWKGQAIVNILQLSPSEKITALLVLEAKKKQNGYLLMATKNGIVKKTPIKDFAVVRHSGLIAIKLNKNDYLGWAKVSSILDEIILITKNGQSIRFKEKDIRAMGRPAAGVRGIRLKKSDEVVGMEIINLKLKTQNLKLLVVMENGFGKTTDLKYFKIQRRGGSGIKAAKVTSKTGKIVTAKILKSQDQDLIAISEKGQVIRTPLGNIPNLGRATQGVRIMRLNEGDKVASVTCV